MAKDPTFPFYAQDYLVDTLRWTRGMQGLHVSLMAESWANGGLVNENDMPSGLGSTDVELWLKIKHKWRLVDGFWTNDKLEEVRAARKIFKQKQSEKGILSGKKRKEKQTTVQPKTNNGSTNVEPIESEYENEIEIKLKEAFDEIYIDQLRPKWKNKDFDFELNSFKDKVRGSPEHYRNHDTGGIRLALQSQLRYAKDKKDDRKSNQGTSGSIGPKSFESVNYEGKF